MNWLGSQFWLFIKHFVQKHCPENVLSKQYFKMMKGVLPKALPRLDQIGKPICPISICQIYFQTCWFSKNLVKLKPVLVHGETETSKLCSKNSIKYVLFDYFMDFSALEDDLGGCLSRIGVKRNRFNNVKARLIWDGDSGVQFSL